MIFSAILSFLGGSAFRMIWGEVANYLNKSQDHMFEVERMKLQQQLDDAEHARVMESLKLQSELGIKTVQATSEAEISVEEARAFTTAMTDAFKPTGNFWVDTWNGVIRPSAATIVLILWVSKLYAQGGKMDEWDMALAGTVLGFFFADRSFAKRGMK